MSIFPLPVFEADADPARRDARTDEEIYASLRPPTSIVVRFGAMRMIGEFSYDGSAKPGCGSKLVVRTPRGTEIAEMLTTTCSNSGCGKSVSRAEMLSYIENSGGRDFPFHDHGRVLRLATAEDLARWTVIQAGRRDLVGQAREIAARLREASDPPLKIVDAEPIFGGEMLTFFYLSEERIDFRLLVQELAAVFGTRIEMRHIGARDEARLVADYERCGQHCCCRGFLKVLKPVSMKSAKIQKATLDPLKISGRCGRLMCCLRYEDQTYEELRARLPKLKSRVGTSDGPGVVVDTRTLVQLVLVRLEEDGRELAVPVEELLDPETCPRPPKEAAPKPRPPGSPGSPGSRSSGPKPPSRAERERPATTGEPPQQATKRRAPDASTRPTPIVPPPPKSSLSTPESEPPAGPEAPAGEAPRRKRRRGRRRRGRGAEPGSDASPPESGHPDGADRPEDR